MRKLYVDGQVYSGNEITDQGLKFYDRLLEINEDLLALRNKHSVLLRAKNALIDELSNEITTAKTGIDLGALFNEE